MIKNLITAIRTNEYTRGQAVLLSAILFIVLFAIFYSIDPKYL